MSAKNDQRELTLSSAVVIALPECFRSSHHDYGTQGSPRT